MFWKYNLITASHIGTLLEKENVTLKELMDEEDILQECKAQNKKLIEFLVQPAIMDEMVTLITEEPDEHLDERIRYKYSNIACELLTFDISAINDALISDEALLNKLYSFLDTEKPLNPLLASFFSKTMAVLLTRKSDMLFEYLKSKSDFINLMLSHIETSAIMDLVLKSLTFSENDSEIRPSVIKWLNDQNIVRRLVALIDPAFSEDCNCNAAHALCDTIKASREHMSLLQETAEREPLLEAIESSEMVSDLLNHMFSGEKKESVIVNGISVLLALLEFKKHGPASSQVFAGQGQPCLQPENAPQAFASFFFRNDGPEQMTPLDVERLSKGVNNSLAAITPQLVNFHKLLLDPPVKPAITLTIGRLEPPFGSSRLEVAHLIMALISTNTHNVNVQLAELGTIPILLDLFFQYKWNNFLHTQVEHSVGRIITNAPTTDEEGNKVHPLLDQLLTKYKITCRILECFQGSEQEQNHSEFQRRGYMGHLTKIANHVARGLESGINGLFIQEKLKGLSEEHCKKWEAFVNGPLAEINKKNTTPLVGGISMPSSSGDDEAVDFRDLQFPHDSALPQMMQMASNFVDQFAFNDEFNETDEHLSGQINRLAHVHFLAEENMLQRNAELFEQVCRDKRQVQSNEDVDSDEDVWEDKEVKSFSFRERKCSDDNSSDSEDDSNGLNATSSLTGNGDDMKMDIDNQDSWTANFDSVPMDVAPVTISNPWDTIEQPSSTSDEQENWADFSNFSGFGSASVECSNEISSTTTIAMETSESTTNIKFVSSSEVSSTSDSTCVNMSHVPAKHSVTLKKSATSNDRSVYDRISPTSYHSTSSKDFECEAKPLSVNDNNLQEKNKRKSTSSYADKDACLSSTIQNGPV